jgi:hypothetical protein
MFLLVLEIDGLGDPSLALDVVEDLRDDAANKRPRFGSCFRRSSNTSTKATLAVSIPWAASLAFPNTFDP